MPDNIIFSIVIPTYNRPDQLSVCLDSISNQTFSSQEFEVIIVDDGSKAPIKQIIDLFIDRINVKFFRQENQGPAAARNAGAKQARGGYIVFTDDDCAPTPEWLKKIKHHIDISSECMVGGRTINALTDNPYSEASQVLISYLYGYYNLGRNGSSLFFTSNNMTVPLESFHKIGGFDQDFPSAAAEDRDFCDRWLFGGYQMEYDSDIIIFHNHELSFKKFWRQHFSYGFGASKFHRMRLNRSGGKLKIEPLLFYINLLLFAFKGTTKCPFLISALLFVSQFANAVGFFSGGITDKFRRKKPM